MDDLPLPDPPIGWKMASSRSKLRQTLITIDYEYEYVYMPHPEHSKRMPTTVEDPVVPPNWVTMRSRHTSEKEADRCVYRYYLSYRSPHAAPGPSAEERQLDDIRSRLLEVLRLEGPATPKDIRDAYYREARLCHPDTAAGADGEARFKAVSEAYRLLSDGALFPSESVFPSRP